MSKIYIFPALARGFPDILYSYHVDLSIFYSYHIISYHTFICLSHHHTNPIAIANKHDMIYRLISVARGEQDYFNPEGIPTATEGCRSNALIRCCKDLGIASELWDPRWIRRFKAERTREVWVEHVVNKRKLRIWVRKDDEVGYPFKETRY